MTPEEQHRLESENKEQKETLKRLLELADKLLKDMESWPTAPKR